MVLGSLVTGVISGIARPAKRCMTYGGNYWWLNQAQGTLTALESWPWALTDPADVAVPTAGESHKDLLANRRMNLQHLLNISLARLYTNKPAGTCRLTPT